ncbi:uncharacterized protein LOC143212690 isoform X2 [Lasioglossum baleicum]
MSPINKRKLRFQKRTGSDISKRRKPNMNNTDIAAFIRKNTIKDSLLLKNPVVILQRLPNIPPCGSQKMSDTIVDKSRKILESTRTRISLNNQNNDKRNTNRLSTNLSLKFSTPRTKQQHWKGNSTPISDSISRRSKKSFDRNNCNWLDVQEQTAIAIHSEQGSARKKNETYELMEPETPNLQRKLRERQNITDRRANSNVKETKKTLNAHLKRLSLDKKRTRIPVLQTSRQKKIQAEKSINRTVAIHENKSIKGAMLTASRRKSKSPMNMKSFTLLAGLRGKSKVNITSNPTIKKLDLKNVTPKKVPNFAEIHEKLFAKSESVVDARKRLRERHEALRTLKVDKLRIPNLTPKNKSIPHKTNENQFRFKLRLNDATNCILKKQPTANPISNRSKTQQQTREFLKGVRTNRRFELQMKTRNMIRQ